MKMKSLALAIAALSAGAAQAAYTDTASNLYLTGASAIRNNVATAVRDLCQDATGTLTVYKQGSSTSSLANQMAYVCSKAMSGTGITTVYHTTTGGSLNSILGMSSDNAKKQIPVDIASATCAAPVAGSGLLAGYTVRAGCGVDAAGASSDGGFSDVEYAPVREQVDILTTTTDGFTVSQVAQGFTGVAQVFGVAVSAKLYQDLQTAQGISCALGDPTAACQPSLNASDIVSMINNNEFAPQKNGAQNLYPGLTADAPIQYARRVTTSGTQSSAQVLFLGKGCLTGPNGGLFDVIGDEIAVGTTKAYNGGLFTVSANSGTSDVINKLVAAGTTSYAFGWVSGENRSPTGVNDWHFIKINDVAMSEGTATGMNKQTAIDGKYQYFVEAVSYKGPSSKTSAAEGSLIDAISAKMATVTPLPYGGPATVGMFILPENVSGFMNADYPTEVSRYQRGGSTPNSCQPVSVPF